MRSDNKISNQYKINFIAAKTSAELEKLRKDPSNNLIRTTSDLSKIVTEYNTPIVAA